MRNLSSAFRHEMYYGNRTYDHKAVITLTNHNVLTLTNITLWSGGFTTDDAVSEDNSFTALGSTIIGSATVIINNIDDSFSQYDFTNAKAELSLSKTYEREGESITESIRMGRYTVDECTYNGATITLSLLDNMEQFDRAYSGSTLQYPATLTRIVQDACLCCGVTLNTYVFPHSDYVIPTRPNDEAITFREILGWVSTIAGCFARCNSNGQLELKWFDLDVLESINEGLDGGIFDNSNPYATGDSADGGSFNPWNNGYDYDAGTFLTRQPIHYLSRLYSQNMGVDDVVITGINILVEAPDDNDSLTNKEYTFGQSGYIIKIENNKLITVDNVQEIGTWLSTQIIGMRFRNGTVTHLNNPSIEAGDIGLVIDRKQNEYPILITRTSYSASGAQTTVCGAESASRNNATRFSEATKSYVDARKLLNLEQSRREQALRELSTALAAKSGLYSTQEVSEGGGTIYYLHDKPLLEDSMVVWKMTAEAWGVSTDGGETWNAGMMVNGDTIVRILSAVGVDADWVTTGALYIAKKINNVLRTIFSADYDTQQVVINAYDTNGNLVFGLDSATGVLNINANTFTLQGNTIAQIARDSVDVPGSLNQQQVFNILTNNGQTQGIFLRNGRLYLNWDYAEGDALTVGGDITGDSYHGYIRVLNAAGVEIAKINSNGIQVGYDTGVGDSWSIKYIALNNAQISGYYSGNRRSYIDLCEYSSDGIRCVINASNCYETVIICPRIRLQGSVSLPGLSEGGATTGGVYHVLTLDTSDGQTVRHNYVSASSKRYKNIQRPTLNTDIQEAYNVDVFQASYKPGYLAEGDSREGTVYPMFIAEQMYEHLPIAVDLNEKGECETWNERVLIPIMYQMIKDQKNEIDELKQRIQKIESLLHDI